ncbi:hypothetical protein H7X46_12300 [Pseudonocardia sp. C8]|uniref:hypothetical protein n=1 Tax=Pseudonocardia sp. C8 TaxID=2762759 RepID=UPI001642AA7A|nr:hypothetical protein [Pseudonocardia sp. C8]MBC3191844.1 hypothetical protein [Pseudonocardia sp. C8]
MAAPPFPGILGGSARDGDRARRASELADLVRTTLELPDEAAVTVSQLACREPGCPPVETVIAVLGPDGRRWTIHRPLADVDDALVVGLLRNDPEGDTHA